MVRACAGVIGNSTCDQEIFRSAVELGFGAAAAAVQYRK